MLYSIPMIAVEIADWYILLATELAGETGRGGSPAKDCDMSIVVSSSMSESESGDGGKGDVGEIVDDTDPR